MNWKLKAAVMRLFATLPYGDKLYKVGQKRFGRLTAKPMSRLPTQARMVQWLRDSGKTVEDMRLFEVGTGHMPIAPIGFFLCGAKDVITVDLHRRIDWNLTRDSIRWISEHRQDVWACYDGIVPEAVFNSRFELLSRLAHDPQRFLDAASIDYRAPTNAAHTGLPAGSMDCHFSITVLEHIPPEAIRDIFTEAKRILKRGGTAVHFVDLSDHFQHQDNSISRINFLKFSETEWQRIAGNEFAYCNRLRASQFLKIFDELGYTVERQETDLDEESISTLKEGEIDPMFANFGYDDMLFPSKT